MRVVGPEEDHREEDRLVVDRLEGDLSGGAHGKLGC